MALRKIDTRWNGDTYPERLDGPLKPLILDETHGPHMFDMLSF